MQRVLIFLVITTIAASCGPPARNGYSNAFTVKVVNPLDVARDNVAVIIRKDEILYAHPDFNENGFYVVDRESEIASQYTDSDGMVVLLDKMAANETRKLTVYYNKGGAPPRTYKKRTQAELSHKIDGEWKNREYIGGRFQKVDILKVPPEHKDHSWFFRYEGPGWESDKVGYRFYLDQRNATDVFGKKTSDLVLMGVGQDGFDSYHEMQSWGMDVMKVGKSLGIGSLGIWVDTSAVRVEKTDSVVAQVIDGTLRSEVNTVYHGWKTERDTLSLVSSMSIEAGSRWTRHNVFTMTEQPVNTLCTGIVKDNKAGLFKSTGSDKEFGYIATYGKQSLNNDNLGLAIIFAPNEFVDFQEDDFSHVVRLRAESFLGITYYFGAAWELEPGGITNEADFIEWVKTSARELANPVVITVN